MQVTQVRQNNWFSLKLHMSDMTLHPHRKGWVFNFTFMESLSSLTCKAIGNVETMEFSVRNSFISFPITPYHLITKQK